MAVLLDLLHEAEERIVVGHTRRVAALAGGRPQKLRPAALAGRGRLPAEGGPNQSLLPPYFSF
jgi:hypothetical protein